MRFLLAVFVQASQQHAGGTPAQQQQQQQQQQGGSGQLPYPPATYMQQFYAQQALAEDLRKFWAQMMVEVEEHSESLQDFKTQALPLARIKKIMKSDEDVRMISAEAPVLFARACEFFIQELTLRAWSAAQEYKRRTLQRSDVATAIARTDIFDFLVDIVPREEANNESAGGDTPTAGQMAGAGAASALPMGQASVMPLGMYPSGGQQAQQQQAQQQQQFLPPPGQPQYMQPPQQQGGQGSAGMLSYNLQHYMAPTPFTFPSLSGPSQQAGAGQLPPEMQFPPPQ